MRLVHRKDLPHHGSSHQFVGADHGGIALSAYFYRGQPGQSIGAHWHPYVEVHMVEAGRGRYLVGDVAVEAGAGDIVVVEPGEVHGLTVLGDTALEVIGLHLSPRFIQTAAGSASAEEPTS